ncbi:hypothetical protein ACFQ71_23530 [Streptomyces sp. NPDC056534]|uniref:hypothetical protein n=1 Tax=Streptomyces sp. NPDC056534 TaxID=3345857 RepID=UPI00368A51EE
MNKNSEAVASAVDLELGLQELEALHAPDWTIAAGVAGYLAGATAVTVVTSPAAVSAAVIST